VANQNTGISWTQATLNPLVGCSLADRSCTNCYAQSLVHRFQHEHDNFAGLTEIGNHGARWNGKVNLVPAALDLPKTWRKPKRIFVASLSDVFHANVPTEYIARIGNMMREAPWHQYQTLSKRADRMRDLFQGELRWMGELPQAWWGVSVGTRDGLWRLDALRDTPAMTRFVSAEPLLEHLGQIDLRGIDWLIAGGESGNGARPCDPEWIRSLVRRCDEQGTTPYVKQLGSVWARGRGKGEDPNEWPEDLRRQEYPAARQLAPEPPSARRMVEDRDDVDYLFR
jgi:protein gp37